MLSSDFRHIGHKVIEVSHFSGLAAIVMMLIGIGLVTKSGFYVFQIFDDHSVSLGLLFIAFFQVVAVSWVYGTDK